MIAADILYVGDLAHRASPGPRVLAALQTLLPLACSLQNIRVWDLQDYVCLQSFCGKLFTLGNCPITSAYFHRDRSLICTTYNVSAVRGTGPANKGCPMLAWLWSLGGSGS